MDVEKRKAHESKQRCTLQESYMVTLRRGPLNEMGKSKRPAKNHVLVKLPDMSWTPWFDSTDRSMILEAREHGYQ